MLPSWMIQNLLCSLCNSNIDAKNWLNSLSNTPENPTCFCKLMTYRVRK